MLRHLDDAPTASLVETAMFYVYKQKKSLTRDVGGTAGTSEFADAVIAALA
jgi:isocitrate dehydrogenase (NAD+)